MDDAPDDKPAARFGRALLDGLSVAGGAFTRGARAVGGAVAAGYRAVDPDVRRHVAQLPLVGLSAVVPRDEVIEPLANDGHRPLLFVHGLGGHRGNFTPMRTAFELMGRSRSYGLSLSDGLDLDALGERLRADIRRVIAVNELPDDAKVDVVAHSMGGVVTRIALEDPETAARVRTVVTLGTPHRGTYAARYADTIRARALRPKSELMTRLAAQEPWAGPPTMPRLVCFWSEADMMILPAEGATVEGAESVEMEGFTHAGYLLHPRCFGRVFEVLGRG